MKELPILFSAEMVRAIRRGRKTQTRRVIKKVPCDCGQWLPYELSVVTPEGWQGAGHSGNWSCECCGPNDHLDIKSPYGVPGDRLWVRETWADDVYEGNREIIIFRADGHAEEWQVEKWKPSIHMPRWASRILLEVADVRVQRVREISEDDAVAEGVVSTAIENKAGDDYTGLYATEHFAFLWDSINAKRGYGWDVNPWVWAVTFTVLEGEVGNASE